MAMIGARDRSRVQERLAHLKAPAKLVVFTQETECEFCKQNRELAEELASLSDKISVEVRDFQLDEAVAGALGIDKIPAIAVLGPEDSDYGVRLYGIPAGYEFSSLIESIETVSSGDSGLSTASRESLKQLRTPIRLQVFVTPTCPHCPKAVILAHKLAVESDQITADMVEATEFPHLANRYGVSGVPHTVIGESLQPMVGAYPEQAAVEMILRNAG